MLEPGAILYGRCGGRFRGRHPWQAELDRPLRVHAGDKRVEAIGSDWVVARDISRNTVVFADCPPSDLEEFTNPTLSDEVVQNA